MKPNASMVKRKITAKWHPASPSGICQTTIDSLDEILAIAKILTSDNRRKWLFRGQNDASWGLQTSLERCANEFDCLEIDRINNVELNIIEEFKKNAHFYMHEKPDIENFFEWSCIIQHYGGPTRLLDCTMSIYIATFFAIDSSKSDATIWCFDESSLLESDYLKNNETFHKFFSQENYNIARINSPCQKFISAVIRNPDCADAPMILPVSAAYVTERVHIQRGRFLALVKIDDFTGEETIFEKNICAALKIDLKEFEKLKLDREYNSGSLKKQSRLHSTRNAASFKRQLRESKIIKINIPALCRKEIAKDLDAMNITSSTLFPGLDGFSRSLKLNFLYN